MHAFATDALSSKQMSSAAYWTQPTVVEWVPLWASVSLSDKPLLE